MSGFTFFSEKDIYKLSKHFYKYVVDEPAVITDLALLQGVDYNRSDTMVNHGLWWLQDCDSEGLVKCVDKYGVNIIQTSMTYTDTGARPVIKYSEIKPLCKVVNSQYMGWKIVTCGEYPQFNPGYQVNSLLERNYKYKLLKKLPFRYSNCENMFYNNEVYEFQGKKYIRCSTNKLDDNIHYFRNNEYVVYDEPQWIEIMPIQFVVDEKDDIAISKYVLFSGMPYNYFVDAFDRSRPKKYLDNCFFKEIFWNADLLKDVNSVSDLEEEQYVGDYDLGKVTEEDIIKGAIESDISVFLHGKSGDGKSDRIKKLDPDSEIIYMRNATPESLNGKSVYDASIGRMIDIPPTWYKNVVDKCNSEPDKIHLVFFDELTNALPSMQGMAFNIILDKEVNGKWKLPKNVKIVAAGNDLEDSLAANKMAEPLFNRFAHVYINTEVDDWLKWALDEEDSQRLDYEELEEQDIIHPDIISYIEYQFSLGHNALRTDFNGIKPNADPRKWEMASRMLYKTKKPEMLRALIGEDLTDDFIFYIRNRKVNNNKNYVKRRL